MEGDGSGGLSGTADRGGEKAGLKFVDFARNCVSSYKELTGNRCKYRHGKVNGGKARWNRMTGKRGAREVREEGDGPLAKIRVAGPLGSPREPGANRRRWGGGGAPGLARVVSWKRWKTSWAFGPVPASVRMGKSGMGPGVGLEDALKWQAAASRLVAGAEGSIQKQHTLRLVTEAGGAVLRPKKKNILIGAVVEMFGRRLVAPHMNADDIIEFVGRTHDFPQIDVLCRLRG